MHECDAEFGKGRNSQVRWDFTGQGVVVTGASEGIGLAIARAFYDAGAHVFATGRSLLKLGGSWRDIRQSGDGRLHLLELELGDRSSIERFAENLAAFHVPIDILVNNAGVLRMSPMLEVEEADWDAVIDVNLKGTYFLTQAVVKSLFLGDDARERRIVSLSSTFGITAFPNRSIYGLSKAGLVHLTRLLATEWAKYRITVNAVAPTAVNTPTRTGFLSDPAQKQEWLNRIPLGRLPSDTDVANAVLFLASDAARNITGHTLMVDGGWTIW